MRIPKISFSKWYSWSKRKNMPERNRPGVYLLAKFKKVPKGRANPLDNHIIYIGETCDNFLKQRWAKFHISAFKGKFGHSGGSSYRYIYGDNGRNLYVAALPVSRLSKRLEPLFIRFVERKCIFYFALKHGKPPRLNLK